MGDHGNLLNITIQNFKVRALVDTGATISCLSHSFLQKLPTSTLKPSPVKSVMGVGNQVHQVTGCVTLSLKFCDAVTLHHTFHVISGNQPLILGMDFLKSHKCQINLDSNSVLMYGWTFPLVDPTSCALAAKTVRVPPESVFAIPVHIPSHFSAGSTILLDSLPLDNISSALKVTPVIDTAGGNKDQAYCRLINHSTSNIVVPEGTALARVSVINTDSLESVSQETPENFVASLSGACADSITGNQATNSMSTWTSH